MPRETTTKNSCCNERHNRLSSVTHFTKSSCIKSLLSARFVFECRRGRGGAGKERRDKNIKITEVGKTAKAQPAESKDCSTVSFLFYASPIASREADIVLAQDLTVRCRASQLVGVAPHGWFDGSRKAPPRFAWSSH